MGMMINRRRVCGGKSLPYDYDAEIEYLESTGTQWIDTNYIPSGILYVDMTYMPISLTKGEGGVSDPYAWNALFASNFWLYPRFGHSTSRDRGFKQYNNGENEGFRDDRVNKIVTRRFIYPSIEKTPDSCSVYLLYVHKMGYDALVPFVGRIMNFAISNTETTILDFIPVRVGTTGYMYDKVSGRLFGNAGTGNFILGPDK